MGKNKSGFSSFTYLVVGLFFGTMSLLRDINYFYREGSPLVFFSPFLIKLKWMPWTFFLVILIIAGIAFEHGPKKMLGNIEASRRPITFVENIIKYVLYIVVIFTVIAFFGGLYFALKGTPLPK